MKKYYKILFIMFVCSNFLMADMVFNLGGQQFFNSVKGNFKDSTYNLKNTIVSTALKFDKGHYIPNGSGSFQVKLKEPTAKWGVTFDIDAYFGGRGLGVTLLGKDGDTLTLFFNEQKINIDGNVTKIGAFSGHEKILGSLHSDGKIVKVIINGEYVSILKKPNFKLAYIEANLGTGYYYSTPISDRLNGLAISTSD